MTKQELIEEVKKELELSHHYDFKSEFWDDELKVMLREIISASYKVFGLEDIDNPAEWAEKTKKELSFYKQQFDDLSKNFVALLEEKEALQAENERLRAALTEIRNYTPATSGYSNEAAMKRIAGEAIKGE